MRTRIFPIGALVCSLLVVAAPAPAAAVGPTVSVADLVFEPWHVGGGPSSFKQAINFKGVEQVGRYLDRIRISVPQPLRSVIEAITVRPVDTIGGQYNYCWTDLALCAVGGSGTVTVTYKTSFGVQYPADPLVVSATLDASGVSGSGQVRVVPKADLGVSLAKTVQVPDHPTFAIESVGPSISGPLTVTVTGFTKQEKLGDLSAGCDWSGIKLVCRFDEILPQLKFNGCLGLLTAGPFGLPVCRFVRFFLPPSLPSKRLTATVSGPYNDPNRSNNSITVGTDPAAAPEGDDGGNSTTNGSAQSDSDAVTPSPPSKLGASPSAQPQRSEAVTTPPSKSSDQPLTQVRQAAPIPAWTVWSALAASLLLAVGAAWIVRSRRAAAGGAAPSSDAARHS